MKFGEKCWAFALRLLDFVTFAPLNNRQIQQPVGSLTNIHQPNRGGPIFSPPNGPDDFFCDYSHMGGQGWHKCSTPSNRECWLTNGTTEYNIHTDYETKAPTGITRKYTLDVGKKVLAPDGWFNPNGKVFNQSYPGPWIKACWGDNIEITVKNHLKYNGTTIHWHGIRQLGTMEADGVNGVTQCPIAGYPTEDSYTYKFKALQYGSSWYHSHYALQYSDGLIAPLTIFGPSSANYDEAVDPLLMTDWVHQSAFSLFWQEITPGPGPPIMNSILLNGVGHFPCSDADKQAKKCIDQPTYYNTTFKAGKKYLLRLINTSTATTYIFSIDNHKIKVIGADFVPIKPYDTDKVLVGIGQRYHVIVEAKPTGDNRPKEKQAYWIRTTVATRCSGFNRSATPDDRTGILYYEGANKNVIPDTNRGTFSLACADEPYDKLKPVVPWSVGRPSNEQEASTFQVGLDNAPYDGPQPPPAGDFSHWVLGKQPLWLDFSNPTILDVNKRKTNWPPEYVVVPEPVNDNMWVYLLITANAFPFGTTPGRNFLPVNHPIHLHGHDFAILKQSTQPYWDGDMRDVHLDNPPRRDVALLPLGGYLVIAFKADNPGSWLMHCHIAWHASSGLALQLLERDTTPTSVPISNITEIKRVCRNWKLWVADEKNWWDATADDFQDDSGI